MSALTPEAARVKAEAPKVQPLTICIRCFGTGSTQAAYQMPSVCSMCRGRGVI